MDEFKKFHTQLSHDIRFVLERIRVYYNKMCEDTPPFREGEKVYFTAPKSEDKMIKRNIGLQETRIIQDNQEAQRSLL